MGSGLSASRSICFARRSAEHPADDFPLIAADRSRPDRDRTPRIAISPPACRRCSSTAGRAVRGPAEWLMTREPVLGILGSIVPSRVMAGLRQRYERGMATTEDDKPAESPGQRALAEKIFGEDRRLVGQIFANAPFVLGDGQSFMAQAPQPEKLGHG
jgi:hypothetical protein